jgi:hypothetical protein
MELQVLLLEDGFQVVVEHDLLVLLRTTVALVVEDTVVVEMLQVVSLLEQQTLVEVEEDLLYKVVLVVKV